MGYCALASRSTVLTKDTGCSMKGPSAWSPEEASPAPGAFSCCGCSFLAAVVAFARPSWRCFASVQTVDAALAQRSSLTATRAALAE